MFNNPLVGSFLSSSGAIPVKRNPNSGSTDKKVDASVSQADLFKSTTLALAADQVVGIFPEGTSYTQPSIVQVLSGAAWAAVEYTKWSKGQNGADGEDLIIVPVGIVYTDKSQYQSRVCSVFFSREPQAERPHRSAFSESRFMLDFAFLRKGYNRYGKPIKMSEYRDSFLQAESAEDTRELVKRITSELDARLRSMTVNAPDW